MDHVHELEFVVTDFENAQFLDEHLFAVDFEAETVRRLVVHQVEVISLVDDLEVVPADSVLLIVQSVLAIFLGSDHSSFAHEDHVAGFHGSFLHRVEFFEDSDEFEGFVFVLELEIFSRRVIAFYHAFLDSGCRGCAGEVDPLRFTFLAHHHLLLLLLLLKELWVHLVTHEVLLLLLLLLIDHIL